MRPESLYAAIRARREALQEAIFKTPPQSYEEFVERKGIWIGLGESLGIIEDARKSEQND